MRLDFKRFLLSRPLSSKHLFIQKHYKPYNLKHKNDSLNFPLYRQISELFPCVLGHEWASRQRQNVNYGKWKQAQIFSASNIFPLFTRVHRYFEYFSALQPAQEDSSSLSDTFLKAFQSSFFLIVTSSFPTPQHSRIVHGKSFLTLTMMEKVSSFVSPSA